MGVRVSMRPSLQLLRARGIGKGHAVQIYIAQSAIRRMRKYTPQDSHTLANSAQVAKGGTEIRQSTPYARKQYESTSFRHRGIQTSYWFEAMKRNGGVNAILAEARRRAGAK